MDDNYDNIPVVQQPRTLSVPLHRHQLANIYTMEHMELTKRVESETIVKDSCIGFLSPETGSGKTATVIGLIVRDKMEWDLDVPFVFETIKSYAGGRIKSHRVRRLDKVNCTFVLMSSTILHQWQEEFSHTELKVGVVSSIRQSDTIDPNDYDVVLVTTTMYNKFINNFKNIAWKRFIFDEPGHVRVPSMKTIEAGFYWMVTATPHAVIRQHGKAPNSFMKEILCCSEYEFNVIFGGMIIQNDTEFIRQSFNMPPTYNVYHECYQPLSNIVHGFVSSAIQTMIEAGNIEGAITALGGNKTSNVVQLVKRRRLEELEEIECKIKIYTIRDDQKKIDEWEARKGKVEQQINEIDKRFETLLHSDCMICMCELKSPVMEPGCQNLFCGTCLLKWIERTPTCPMCRGNVEVKELVYIETSRTSEEEDLTNSTKRPLTKLEIIIEIIKSKGDGKFIIFSAFDDTFVHVNNVLEVNNIKYTQIRGSLKTKENNISKYKTGDVQVLCLNSTASSSGLNLQETSDIILYHEMQEDTLNQIIGRANRIGRTFPLHVHHLKITN